MEGHDGVDDVAASDKCRELQHGVGLRLADGCRKLDRRRREDIRLDLGAKRFQDIGAAIGARHSSVAVLCDSHTAGGGNERGRR